MPYCFSKWLYCLASPPATWVVCSVSSPALGGASFIEVSVIATQWDLIMLSICVSQTNDNEWFFMRLIYCFRTITTWNYHLNLIIYLLFSISPIICEGRDLDIYCTTPRTDSYTGWRWRPTTMTVVVVTADINGALVICPARFWGLYKYQLI